MGFPILWRIYSHEFFQEMKEFLIRFFPFARTRLLVQVLSSVCIAILHFVASFTVLALYFFFFFTYRKSISITGNPLRFLAQQ